ncbi:MAG TPA: UDP-N-acetylmuramate:L-alanyl-gamma-D-glutamyl-meso-diaminopimelate ligase [Acidobacteria bacterium]|nr:UDP-N-acetylmuramate:L-alanyl-gamma-D-glutamyl-meso-diaminopimelate ligase [Acidobacteriota bacterium]
MTAYLIGICGTAMAPLAAMLKESGWEVRGSDAGIYPPMDRFLEEQGIFPLLGYDAFHITEDIDVVVIGNAVSRGNPEVEAVLDKRLRYMSLPEMLRDRFLWSRKPIVVAGTHGKTTTTSMIAWSLVRAGSDPSFLIGGIPENFGASFRIGNGRSFVIEGDEYDSAFFDKTAKCLKYLPDIAVVGNVEFDHVDIYEDLDAVRATFRRFLGVVPANGRVMLGGDDGEASALKAYAKAPVETFGLNPGSNWRAVDLVYESDSTTFKVLHENRGVADVSLPLLGAFNVRNALAAIAVADAVGVNPNECAEALGEFRGVRRRLELRGTSRNISIYDDFAHHPTAIRETLGALRAKGDHRICAVFEPRSATACRKVFQQSFAEALALADDVVVAPVFRTTIPDKERLSVEKLVGDLRAVGTCAYAASTLEDVCEHVVDTAQSGDVIVLMSNGEFGRLHNDILARLEKAPEDPSDITG